MLVAVDPGDRYVGVAFFEEDVDSPQGWICVDAQEMTPDEFSDGLAELLLEDNLEFLVVEKFRLYQDHAMEQVGSEFFTSQLIGVIKWLCRKQNEHYHNHALAEVAGKMLTCEAPGGVCHDPERKVLPVMLEIQPADIKKPTAGILRKKKIKSVAGPISKEQYGGRDHIKDAELHGWHFILNRMPKLEQGRDD